MRPLKAQEVTATIHYWVAMLQGEVRGHEEYAGGPLTRFALAGLIAACCGCAAMAFSFRLHPYRSPKEKQN